MDITFAKTNLKAVIAVLNNIEVKGKQNLDNLSGCIRIVSEVVEALPDSVGQPESE